MNNSLCAHCLHCEEVKYHGFFCEETGCIENVRIGEKCKMFEDDDLDSMAKMIKQKLIEVYPKTAEFSAARRGRWVFVGEVTAHDGWTYRKYKCSECNFSTIGASDFCQNCGADMREGGADNG